MTNPTPDRNETIIRSVLFIAVVLLAVGIIVYLKRSTDVPLTPEGMAARDSVQRMASPDTTTAPAENAPTLDTTTEQSTDTVSVDQRLPSDAGYEDGYFAGLQDGLDDMERASYDDSSKFLLLNNAATTPMPTSAVMHKALRMDKRKETQNKTSKRMPKMTLLLRK